MKNWQIWLLFGSSLLFFIFGVRHYIATSNVRSSYERSLKRFKMAFDLQNEETKKYISQDSLLITQLIEIGREKNKTIVNYDARRIYEHLIKGKADLPAYEEFITRKYTWAQLEEMYSRMDDDMIIEQTYDGSFSQFLGELYAFKSFDVDYYINDYSYLF